MSDPTSVDHLDLSPIPGKKYFSIDREWREEFIYFLMVDRFQDDVVRPVTGGAGRTAGIATPDTFYGGKIKGITQEPGLHRRPGVHGHLALARSSRTTRTPTTATTSTTT